MIITRLRRFFANNPSAWLVTLVFVAALVPRVTTLGGTFIVNDEPLYWQWSNDFANALLHGDWRGTMVGIGYPSITVTWAHTLGISLQAILHRLEGASPAEVWRLAALDQPFIFNLLAQRRVVIGVINALLIALVYRQVRQLLPPSVALLSALLMAFNPFLLADARTMRGDALMSSLMLLSVLCLLDYLRRKQWPLLLGSGVAFGLALLTKMTALPLTGFIGLAVFAHALYHPELSWLVRLRRGVITLLAFGAATVFTVWLLWPALWVAPLEVWQFMSQYAASSIDGRLNFFWGRLTTDQQIWLFYPNAFLFRANPIVVLGMTALTALTLVGGWRWTHHRPAFEWGMPASYRLTVLALGAYVAVYGSVITLGALKRDRYLMPIFPAVLIMAAAGLLWLTGQIARHRPGKNLPAWLSGGRWAWGVLGILLALELGHILSTHPFYYTYWNPLMGGGRVAMNVMLAEGGIDSAAVVQLNRLPGAEQKTLAVLTSRDFAPAFSGKVVRLVDGDPWITADYILIRQFHFQTEKVPTSLMDYLKRRPPLLVNDQQGYIWSWVYPGPTAEFYAGSVLEGKMELLGYNLSTGDVSENRPLTVKFFWQNHGLVAPEYIFLRLVDDNGFVWAETPVKPLPDFASVAYQADAFVEGEAVLDVPPGTPPGLYHLQTGIATTDPDEPEIGRFTLPAEAGTVAVKLPDQPSTPALDTPINRLVGKMTLLGVEKMPAQPLTPQTPQPLTLFWRTNEAVSSDYEATLRLLDQSGAEVRVWQGRPAQGVQTASQWQSGQIIRDPWILDVPSTVPPGRYTLAVSLADQGSGQTMPPVRLGEVAVADRLRLFTLPAVENKLDIQLGDNLALLGYNFREAPVTGGARFVVKFFWQAQQPVTEDYTVFVQVLGPDGTVVGQHDGVPGNGALPTSAWGKGEIVPDRHLLEFPVAGNGAYRLIAGMYNPLTGERLPVFETNGNSGGDFVSLYTLKIGD